MTRIGFFLNVRPGERSVDIERRPFLREALIAAADRSDIELVIATPSWFQSQLREWLKKRRLSDRATILVGRGQSSARILAIDLLRRGSEGASLRENLHRVRQFVRRAAAIVGRSSSRIWLPALGLVIAMIVAGTTLALAIGAVPLMVAAMVLIVVITALVRYRNSLARFLRAGLTLSRSEQMRLLYRSMVDDHIDAVTRAANRANVDVWLVAQPYTFGSRKLNAPLVAFVPALLPLEDPLGHSFASYEKQHARILELLDRCVGVICHDDIIKRKHLVYGAGLPAERVHVVPPGKTVAPEALGGSSASEGTRTLRALQIVRPMQHALFGGKNSQLRIDLGRDPFIICAGNETMHRHCIVLLRALKAYNLHAEARLHLVLRKSLLESSMVERWLHDEADELYPYIIPIDSLTFRDWLALHALARCAVDTSLSASAFPDTFSQALCVRTPILMSDIPAVRSVIADPALAQDMLYDPYDPEALRIQLAAALENRRDLVAKQWDVYEALPTWRDAGEHTLELLAAASSKQGLA